MIGVISTTMTPRKKQPLAHAGRTRVDHFDPHVVTRSSTATVPEEDDIQTTSIDAYETGFNQPVGGVYLPTSLRDVVLPIGAQAVPFNSRRNHTGCCPVHHQSQATAYVSTDRASPPV